MQINIRHITDFLKPEKQWDEKWGRSVDELLYGYPDTMVKGVAVTFLATQDVIEKAIKKDANLIISHEGIFYSHKGIDEKINFTRVYRKKLKTIKERGISIYRYHDGIHMDSSDGIMEGLLKALGWKEHEIKAHLAYSVVKIQDTLFEDVIGHVKESLGIKYIRYSGSPTMKCSRIGIFVGYRGAGGMTIPLIEKENLDLLIYGEGPEWETPEYIRDARYQGENIGLIVLGHKESEAPGMENLAQKLQKGFPTIPVHFISEEAVLSVR